MQIPDEFFEKLGARDWAEIDKRNALNRGQCIRLWEFLGREDEPPPRIDIFLRDDAGNIVLLVGKRAVPEPRFCQFRAEAHAYCERHGLCDAAADDSADRHSAHCDQARRFREAQSKIVSG